MTISEIKVTLAAGEWSEGSFIDDQHGYNTECDDVLDVNVHNALVDTYPGAKVSVSVETVAETSVYVAVESDDEDGEDFDEFDAAAEIEQEIVDMIERIGERVRCGDLAPDVEPFMNDEAENEVA